MTRDFCNNAVDVLTEEMCDLEAIFDSWCNAKQNQNMRIKLYHPS